MPTYTTDLNPFNFERSVNQWRVLPKKASAFDGSFVFNLGYDGTAPNVEELNVGDFVQTSQTVNVTGVGVVRVNARIFQPQTMPDQRDVSKDFQLLGESGTSIGNRVVIPAGVSDSDVGRTITVSGCSHSGNNTNMKIVGIQDPITVFVDQTVTTEGPKNGTIVVTELGVRWKFSLFIDGSPSLTERARIVQDYREAGFYRRDLTINVSKLTGNQNIHFRMTLIAHNPNNIYTMP